MKTITLFIFGLATGSFVSGYIGYVIAKQKYETLADKEVSSVKQKLTEYYEGSKKNPEKAIDISDKSKKEEDPVLKDIIRQEQYKNYSQMYKEPETETKKEVPQVLKPEERGSEPESKAPYLIDPGEFKDSDYETKTLFLYRDNVLADDDGNIVDNIDECIGHFTLDQLDHKVYSDAIYVRNEAQGIDYEILLDERTFFKKSVRESQEDSEDED